MNEKVCYLGLQFQPMLYFYSEFEEESVQCFLRRNCQSI